METTDLDDYFILREMKEKEVLNKQMKSGLKMLAKWEAVFKEENPKLFENMLNVKIPYWKNWIGKYQWVAPSITNILQESWDIYKDLKRKGETETLNSLF